MDTTSPLSSVITQVNSHGDQIVVSPDHKDKVSDVVKIHKKGLFSYLCCISPTARRLKKSQKSSSCNASRDSVKVSDEDCHSTESTESKEKLPQENGNLPHEPNHNHIERPGNSYLLPAIRTTDQGKKCMVIDLDETLVHSSFKPISNADFIVPVEIDGTVHQVYVLKRPHVDEYLQRMGELYECVLFTASLSKYADPVADLLDKWGVFRARLFRESCVYHRGNYVKDLSKLGRDLSQILIVDNSPASYIFHPDNAVPVTSWFDDMSDTELSDMIPFLTEVSQEKDVYSILRHYTSRT